MNNIFQALAEEATFTKEILASGVTQVRNANYAKKGAYFQSFTSLSTGLERLGKLCLLLDYYLKNNGKFTAMDFIKNQIGHDLLELYERSKDTVKDNNVTFRFRENLDEPIHQNILKLLSDFAKGDRYSNINFLLTQTRISDPIFEWNDKIDTIIYEERVSDKKKKKIEMNAEIIDKLSGSSILVRHSSESRIDLTTVRDASYATGMTEAISKYRQLYLLQIIRYWVELIDDLQYKVQSNNYNEIPSFSRIFAIFYNEDKYFLTRKTYS